MKQFAGKKIYYSGSIRGASEQDKQLPYKLVEHLKSQGAQVLSEHVAQPTFEEVQALFRKNISPKLLPLLDSQDRAQAIRQQDMVWVEEATHLIAVINAPSHGVGMEIERAILKPELGLNKTPILCLVHENVEKVSGMISGVTSDECDVFQLSVYSGLESAIEIAEAFLQETYS